MEVPLMPEERRGGKGHKIIIVTLSPCLFSILAYFLQFFSSREIILLSSLSLVFCFSWPAVVVGDSDTIRWYCRYAIYLSRVWRHRSSFSCQESLKYKWFFWLREHANPLFSFRSCSDFSSDLNAYSSNRASEWMWYIICMHLYVYSYY